MDTIKIDKTHVKMVAHRGVSGIERENSNFAFVAAGNRSYFGIETDVWKTSDGKYIISHDGDTGRCASDNLHIESTKYETLRNLTLSDKDGAFRGDLKMPALDDYVKICKRYEKVGVLELKSDFTTDELKEIVAIINSRDYLENIIFISFNLNNLLRLREFLPDQTMQFLCGRIDEAGLDLLASKNFGIDIIYPELLKDDGYVQLIKSKGIKINCWTVDSKEDAEKLDALGVDFITSNILE